MEANQNKFQILIAGNSDLDINIDQNVSVKSEKSVKLLGVNLDNDLNFNDHINTIVRKASRQLNCLKRIANSLDLSVKLLLYKCFVLSNFNYCPVVWHACGAINTKKLEKVQFRALKFVFSDYSSSYIELLNRAKLPSLEVSRLRSFAIEVYKAYKKISPSYINNLVEQHKSGYNLRKRDKNIMIRPNRTTKYGLHSFRHTGGMLWNALPEEYKGAKDLKTFKLLIQTWSGGPLCSCTLCRQ